MRFKLTNPSGFVAVLAILFGTSIAIAAKHPAPSVRVVGLEELEMQVLLDRANFSPGQIDDENGKNSREVSKSLVIYAGLVTLPIPMLSIGRTSAR